jgi:hypothetical protein
VKDYQKHIKDTHADRKGKAICGATLAPFDWTFMDVDHAFLSLISESSTQPCPACAKAVINAFAAAE